MFFVRSLKDLYTISIKLITKNPTPENSEADSLSKHIFIYPPPQETGVLIIQSARSGMATSANFDHVLNTSGLVKNKKIEVINKESDIKTSGCANFSLNNSIQSKVLCPQRPFFSGKAKNKPEIKIPIENKEIKIILFFINLNYLID
ncbi:MAG: hypothetical protein RJA61_267 [Candidatus Parcubacteria bacterium]|jgi:hypothetical protein